MACHSYAKVSEIPDEVDLAVVAVPAEEVLDVVADCAEAGVRTLLVLSAGFAESGPEGAERQVRLLAGGTGSRHAGPRAELVRHHQQPPVGPAQRLAGT